MKVCFARTFRELGVPPTPPQLKEKGRSCIQDASVPCSHRHETTVARVELESWPSFHLEFTIIQSIENELIYTQESDIS